jgi:hypothetical protein
MSVRVIGGDSGLWRVIGGVWRAETDEIKNYIYAIAL